MKGFIERVNENRLSVVFDTQHVLEWYYGETYVSGLTQSQEELRTTLLTLWRLFRDQVVEIHLADFHPELGSSRGRNVFPGTGVLDLKTFAQEVRSTNWDGIITPEVSPFGLKGHSLHELYDYTEQLFK